MALPSLKALRAFEVLSRHLSLSRAAEELFVTPAAVNQLVRALEDDLGFELFHRSNRQYVLSEAAKAGLSDLKAGFDMIASGVDQMRRFVEEPRVTVSVAPSFAASWLVPRLDQFRRNYPEIDVFIEVTSEVVDLDHGRVDMAIRYGSGGYEGLSEVPLFRETFFPVCSPDYANEDPALSAPEDLRNKTLLHVDWPQDSNLWPTWSDWFAQFGLREPKNDRGLRFDQQHLAVQAAVLGQGVALGSSVLAKDALDSGRLVKPFDAPMDVANSYRAVFAKRNAKQPGIIAFCSWLQSEAGGFDSDD